MGFHKNKNKRIYNKILLYKKKKKNEDVKQLKDKLNLIESSIKVNTGNEIELKTEYKMLKNELDRLYAEKSRAYQIRSRVQWIEEGEKSTSYFLKMEKKRQTYNTITRLKKSDGKLVQDNQQILQTCENFYSKLYTSNHPDEKSIDEYLSSVTIGNILSEDDKELCEGLIKGAECEDVLKSLKLNKSPGLDGIPAEFYRTFWYLIGNLVCDSYNESFIVGKLSDSQNTVILSLIFKKNDRLLLKNYRPISLSNCDYKIMAIVLAKRLQKVIGNIISCDQNGYIKGRFIGNNIRLVEDLIEYIEQNNLNGMVLLLDFEKAFDSIEWRFIFKTLEKFNFGEMFIKWMKCIYKEPMAVIKNNGWLSPRIKISRGIKQGCPLSALLFILATEVLSLKIKQCNDYKGLGINQKDIKIIQYADDTIVFPRSDNDITILIDMLNIFTGVAGLRLNIEKTEGIRLGDLKNYNSAHYQIKWNNECVRCLGIYVGLNKKQCERKNWLDKLEEMQKIIDSWRIRKLTLFGKVQVIKSLALSKFVFSATNTATPDYIYKEINKIIYSFIWNNKDRIKRSIVISPIEHGGINLTEIESFFKSLKATWMYKITNNINSTWSTIAVHWLNVIGTIDVVLGTNFTNINQLPIAKKIPLFYQQVLTSYNSSKSVEVPSTFSKLMSTPLWGNVNLKITNKKNRVFTTLHLKSWINCGITYVGDIPFVDGKISVNTISNTIKNNPSLIMECYLVQNALQPFKNLVNKFTRQTPYVSTSNILSEKLYAKSRLYYVNIVKSKTVHGTIKHLSHSLNVDLTREEIQNIFTRKVKLMQENILSEFNYKILHNILPHGALVSKWDPNVSKLCDVCNEEENIKHLLCSCKVAISIWNFISNVFDKRFTDKDILLGIHNDEIMNYILTVSSYVLYKYRIQSWETKYTRSSSGVIKMLKSEITNKYEIYKHRKKKQDYCSTLFKVLV
jgi:hypothetical protein